jgi:hypothetical protein
MYHSTISEVGFVLRGRMTEGDKTAALADRR